MLEENGRRVRVIENSEDKKKLTRKKRGFLSRKTREKTDKIKNERERYSYRMSGRETGREKEWKKYLGIKGRGQCKWGGLYKVKRTIKISGFRREKSRESWVMRERRDMQAGEYLKVCSYVSLNFSYERGCIFSANYSNFLHFFLIALYCPI